MLLSHDELIAELPKLAELNARERKKLNDSRRRAQLDLWEANDHTETDCAPSKLHPVKRRKTSHITLFDPGLVLLNCAALGDVEGVKKLLDQGVNPNVNNVDRITPIHQSCLENDDEITTMLIDAGCDINSLDNELWTPLHAAVSLANLECVNLLLKHGANQLSPNVDGQLPIDLCEDENIQIIMELDLQARDISLNQMVEARSSQETKFFNEVKQLLEIGGNADFQLLDNDATLLHVAAANGYVEVALYLLSKSCKVDVQDIDGWSPLHAASFWEEVDIIELLAAHGANFKLRTFCGELPSDLTEDEDIKNLLQRLTERSELMKRHPGAVLRPSSVRGRLVSRMTTGEKEDKRRESAELHSVFVEQIEQDISKAPDSWRVRTGKYTRSALRDISFEQEQQQVIETKPEEITPQPDMTDCNGTQRPSLERSSSLLESTDYVLPPSDTGLSSICENGEHKDLVALNNDISESGKCPRNPIGDFPQRSVDGSTFELISPSTDTLDLDGAWNNSSKPPTKDGTEEDQFTDAFSPLKVALRKEKSFDDLINSSEKDFHGSTEPLPKTLARSTSLVQTKPAKSSAVKRFYSFRTDMSEPVPGYSPKPNNNKASYKNRKKSDSSGYQRGSIEEDTPTNSCRLSSDKTCLKPSPNTQELDHESISLTTLKVGGGGGDSINSSYQHAPESSSFPDNSMDTHAGSLDRPSEPTAREDSAGQKKEKTRKCCVIS